MAISGTQPSPRRGVRRGPTRRKKAVAKRRATKKPSSGKRVSWDAVLKGLPKTFSVDDVMKRPGVKARGR